MTDRFGYGEIGLDINTRHPCEGCRDYDAPDGCKSNGGCGKPTTNADRIRSMTDEELSSFLDIATVCVCFPCTRDINNLEHYEKCKHESGSCEKEWLEWLKGDTDEDKA